MTFMALTTDMFQDSYGTASPGEGEGSSRPGEGEGMWYLVLEKVREVAGPGEVRVCSTPEKVRVVPRSGEGEGGTKTWRGR